MSKNLALNHINGGGTATLEREKTHTRRPKQDRERDWSRKPKRREIFGEERSSSRFSNPIVDSPTLPSQTVRPKNKEVAVKDSERERVQKQMAEKLRTEIGTLRAKATITLHEACDGKDGSVALRLEYFNQYKDRKIYGWLLLDCKDGWATIIEATTPIKWVEKYGLNDRESSYWVKLNPPLFVRTKDYNCQFPKTVQIWMIKLWVWEEKNILTPV